MYLGFDQARQGLAPHLVSTVCQTTPHIRTSSKVSASGETRPPTVGDILSPLLEKIGGLHCLVDNRVHLQQSAGTSKVGYNAFYTHKHSHSNGLKHYGCTRASEEILAKDREETDRAVQLSKARQKLLLSEQQNQQKTVVEPAKTAAGGDGNPRSKAARKRHNKHQRELYQKRKKARRAQQAKQAAEAAPGAQVPPSEPMELLEANGGCEV